MASSDVPAALVAADLADEKNMHLQSLWRRLNFFSKDKGKGGPETPEPAERPPAKEQSGEQGGQDVRFSTGRRLSKRVVPELPRAQTFKRQQSELRDNLEAVQPSSDERRAVSMDRRAMLSKSNSNNNSNSNGLAPRAVSNPRSSAPEFLHGDAFDLVHSISPVISLSASPLQEKLREFDMISEIERLSPSPAPPSSVPELAHLSMPEIDVSHDDTTYAPHAPDAASVAGDVNSMTTSEYENMIHAELEQKWILNLSMYFRDKTLREKFFVTYREQDTLWRRVTISLDYRDADPDSLEMDLHKTQYQRDKSAKIYGAIRESLMDIQFYDTVTNLKLQTTSGRLHVHVVEDVGEIVQYPTPRMIQHLGCRRVKERDIVFDAHLSGFVYKVKVDGEVLIKKEIPGPETVDEFLYEVNALHNLRHASNVIRFYGVVVDDKDEYVKGLLISYAEQGALIDVIYDSGRTLPLHTREKWARQIIQGLSEIHEAGYVQGDFTLSNIVIDDQGDAKIIDINRRGCPVGWEPPEATALIESGQRISMYIGVKSDLYQLGMVLWALATQDDEPERHPRPLHLDADAEVPSWYRQIVEVCLSEDPRYRVQASHLLLNFPDYGPNPTRRPHEPPSISVDDGYSRRNSYAANAYSSNGNAHIKTVQPQYDWSYGSWSQNYGDSPPPGLSARSYYYPPRGRSPPSPLPSNGGGQESSQYVYWSDNCEALTAPSTSDVVPDESRDESGRVGTERYSIPLKSTRDFLVPGGMDISTQEESEAGHDQTKNLGTSADTLSGAPPRSSFASDTVSPEIESTVGDAKATDPHQNATATATGQKLQEEENVTTPGTQYSSGESTAHVEKTSFSDPEETREPAPETHDDNITEVAKPASIPATVLGGCCDGSKSEPRSEDGESEKVRVVESRHLVPHRVDSGVAVEMVSTGLETTMPADPVPTDTTLSSACREISELLLPLGPEVSVPYHAAILLPSDLPNELTGVGLACELVAEPRQELITEDDLGAEKTDYSAPITSASSFSPSSCQTDDSRGDPDSVGAEFSKG